MESPQMVQPSLGITYVRLGCSALAWVVSPFHSWEIHTSPEMSWALTGAEIYAFSCFLAAIESALAWESSAGLVELSECPRYRRNAPITSRPSSIMVSYLPNCLSWNTAQLSTGVLTLSCR